MMRSANTAPPPSDAGHHPRSRPARAGRIAARSGAATAGPGLATLARTGAATAGLGLALLALTGPSAAADTPPPVSYQAALDPIVANQVTGTGAAWVTVEGDQALVQIQVQGLLDGAPHAQHIHIGAQGTCPTQPSTHRGRPSITVADGQPFYGSIGSSLTLTGDTGPASALHVDDFPTTGSYTYTRTVPITPDVASALAGGTAVLVVHGIDYDGNGRYDDVLGPSELDPALPAEATDPALCGRFEPMQMAGVPVGAAETGGGSTAAAHTLPAGTTSVTAGVAVAGLTAGIWWTLARTVRRWAGRR